MSALHFDDSLPGLLEETQEVLGQQALSNVVVLRDASGQLTCFFDGELSEAQKGQLEQRLTARLGRYARPERVIADRASLGAARILSLDADRFQWMSFGEQRIRYLDRRIVGADWLHGPAALATSPPRFVFASLKGGVGRTTALCVAAAELAQEGKNILVVDLDLEAPGIGSMLLPEGGSPRYGAIDYLAESALYPNEDLRPWLAELVAPSTLTTGSGGRVDVVPAVGAATRPENYLGKLSRALLDAGPSGETLPLRDKIARLLDELSGRSSYDVILIDSRAGLAELAAGPILGLGATVLLFGTAQRQTVEDLRLLFAQLNALIPPNTSSPFQQIQMVLGKMPSDPDQTGWFQEELHTLFQEYIYEEQEGETGFNFSSDDASAPHYPVPIALNSAFGAWDPTRQPGQLQRAFYNATFAPFLGKLRQLSGAI
ncbi:MAG TPA: ParA family protein [Pseudomonadota bacterium]|nr:ParA family protein [Pseudomonadota bacterium]